MSLTAVILLILIGLALILVEFLVLPGTNIAGIVGILLLIGGIYFSYKDIGVPTAHFVLGATLLLMVGSIVLALRSKTWNKLSLNESIDGKVENILAGSVKPGDRGETLTRLAPMGSVLVNEQSFEARAGHHFLDPHTPVEVVKIEGNVLEVKPIEN